MAAKIENLEPNSPARLPFDIYSKSLNALILVSLTGIFFVSIFYRPADTNYFTICGFKAMTGLPCPGCGLTHAFCAIGKGEMLRAIDFNLFGPLLFLAAILGWVRSACVLCDKTEPVAALDRFIVRFKIVRRTILAMTIFGIVRIAWLLMHPSSDLQNSPIVKLIGLLKG